MNIGNYMYKNVVDLDELDKCHPKFQIRKKVGRSKFVRNINQFANSRRNKIAKLQKEPEPTKADLINWVQEKMMDIKDFSNLDKDVVKASTDTYKSIVVLLSDVPTSHDVGSVYKYVIFTTKGKIDIF